MSGNPFSVRLWRAPSPEDIGCDLGDFLTRLGGPTLLLLPGLDRTRTRALATLLHGNETSGFRALYQWLKSGRQPAVDIACFVGAVQTALTPPRFSYRSLPGHKDLNRCFRPPFDGPEGKIAEAIIDRLRHLRPEAMIDLHNTSGIGPAFGVAAFADPRHEALAGLFARRLILTDLRLGALMELADAQLPAVTVECGGSQDPAAHAAANEGLERFFTLPDLFAPQASRRIMEVWINPLRVEVRPPRKIAFRHHPLPEDDVTLRPDIEHFNFRILPCGESLGWVGDDGLDALVIRTPHGLGEVADYFQVQDRQLYPTRPLHLSMATTHSKIARDDCLFYLVPVPA